MPVTLKDISIRVGKSVPTVSRALAGFLDIAPETREEVQKVAREMGYVPNVTARNLQKKRTDSLGLILPETSKLRISDPFFSEFLTGIVEVTNQSHYTLNLSATEPGVEIESYQNLIRSRQVDGFILMRTRLQDPRIDLLLDQGIPFVAFGRTNTQQDFAFVDDDDLGGMRTVVDHLIGLGHSRIGFIAEPVQFTKSYNRLQGYLQGLQAHGLSVDSDLVAEANYRQNSGKLATMKLLSLPNPPTAIIASNDLLALGAYNAAREKGLVIGHDLSVTGFDDILLAEYANPSLTTIHHPAIQFGRLITEMLLKIVRGEPVQENKLIIPPSLVIRQSTGKPHRS